MGEECIVYIINIRENGLHVYVEETTVKTTFCFSSVNFHHAYTFLNFLGYTILKLRVQEFCVVYKSE